METSQVIETEKQAKFRIAVNKYIKSPSYDPDSVNLIITEFFRLKLLYTNNKLIQDLFQNDKLMKCLYESWNESNEGKSNYILLQYAISLYPN